MNSALQELDSMMTAWTEKHGIDAYQVVFSRQEGHVTHSSALGDGNAYARVALCERHVLDAKHHWKQELNLE